VTVADPLEVQVGYPAQIVDQILHDEWLVEMDAADRDPQAIAYRKQTEELSRMPIRLSALSADRRTVRVPFGDDALTVTYRPSAINAVQESRELEDREKGRHLLAQAKSLAEIIVSWDLVDDDGQAVPVGEDVVATLGLDVVSKLTRGILEDLLPNRATATDSRNGSSAAASSVPAPSGTPTS
jgi:hypothetical protein